MIMTYADLFKSWLEMGDGLFEYLATHVEQLTDESREVLDAILALAED